MKGWTDKDRLIKDDQTVRKMRSWVDRQIDGRVDRQTDGCA